MEVKQAANSLLDRNQYDLNNLHNNHLFGVIWEREIMISVG